MCSLQLYFHVGLCEFLILPTWQMGKMRLMVFNTCAQVSEQGGDGGCYDWHPGVCRQTLPTQDGKASSRLSPPNRPANGHEPLIEDWKIIIASSPGEKSEPRRNQCLGREKVPAVKLNQECKETLKHTQEFTRIHTQSWITSSRNSCVFFFQVVCFS